jgi:hypothetical protein
MLVYDTCHLTNNKYIIQYYKHKRQFKLLLLLPNFLFVFEKNQQIKKNNKNPKNYVLDVFSSFLAFFKEFKIKKIYFQMHLIVNMLFESMLMLPFFLNPNIKK